MVVIMQANVDLKQIKKKVYLSYFQDGLWDILLGLSITGWGLMFVLEFTAIMGGVWVGLYFLILAILLFTLDEGSWVNFSLVFLMLLPLFIILSLRRRFSR